MKTLNSIKINGIAYTISNLNRLFVNIPTGDDNEWLTSIQSFLKEWFSNSSFIVTQSSGSTGNPKIIKLPKQSMVNSAKKTIDYFNLTSSDTALLCIPAQYIGGKMMLVRAMLAGFNLIVTKPVSNPFPGIDTPIDFAAITPFQLYHSMDTLREKEIKKIIVGGSPITTKMEKMAANLSSAIYETYGMTETSSHIALRKVNGKDKSDYFTLLKGVEVSLDERSCLVITAQFITNEKIITNDIAEIIGPRHFRILGRYDTIINTGGIKIFPEQIERKLATIIHQPFYITSVPDEVLNSKVVLVLEEDFGIHEAILREKMKEVLSRYEIPKEIRFVSKIDRTETGKVKRN